MNVKKIELVCVEDMNFAKSLSIAFRLLFLCRETDCNLVGNRDSTPWIPLTALSYSFLIFHLPQRCCGVIDSREV